MRRAAAVLLPLAVLGAVLAVVWLRCKPAPTHPTPTPKPSGEVPCAAGVEKIVQGFPARDFNANQPEKSDTAWEICWTVGSTGSSKVLKVVSAKFMWKDKTGKVVWLPVVRQLELAEIYAPYDDGVTAFLDVSAHNHYLTKMRTEFAGPSCVVAPQIQSSSDPDNDQRVMREVHDDGIRWMSAELGTGKDKNDDRARRGEIMLVWSTFYAANYRYLVEYGFCDDGTIRCRVGSTARNYHPHQPALPHTHLHIACWRLEPDFGYPNKVSLYSVRRYPTGLGGTNPGFAVETKPFNPGVTGEAREGNGRWDADKYTSLLVQSDVRVNFHGRKSGYNLIPVRTGAARDLKVQTKKVSYEPDAFNYDFWVTHTESKNEFFRDVPSYAAGQRPLANKSLTVWHSAAAVHIPRGEDFGDDGVNKDTGAAIVAWAEFILKPRDLFDSTPLFTP